MDSFIKESPKQSVRILDRSLSLTDLKSLVNRSLFGDNLEVSSLSNQLQQFSVRPPLVRHFSCEQIYDPSISSQPLIRINDRYTYGNNKRQVSWSNWGTKNELNHSNPTISVLKAPKLVQLTNSTTSLVNNNTHMAQSEPDVNYFGNLSTYPFSFVKECDEKFTPSEATPMEVDKSLEDQNNEPVRCHKSRKLDDECLHSEVQNIDDIKPEKSKKLRKQAGNKKLAKEHPLKKNHRSRTSKCLLFKRFLLFITVSVGLFIFYKYYLNSEFDISLRTKILGQHTHCDQYLDVHSIISDLNDKLVGQDDVVENLSNMLYFDYYLNIIIFTGSTGVGKTYTTQIIEDNFTWKKNIQTIKAVNNLDRIDKKKIYHSLSNCGENLIIFDNLVEKDIKNLIEMISNIKIVSLKRNLKVLIILVFNVQHMTEDIKIEIDLLGSTEQIASAFSRHFDVNVVMFNTLQLEHLQSCVQQSALRLGMDIAYSDIQIIAEDLGEVRGCKGAEAKLQLLKLREEL